MGNVSTGENYGKRKQEQKAGKKARGKLLAGMFSIALVCGIMAAAGCGNSNDTGPKKIIITGLEGKQGSVEVSLVSPEDDSQVYGNGEIVNGSATISLSLAQEGEDGAWTGTGSYFAMLYFYDEDAEEDDYVYTNGKTLEKLGLTESSSSDELKKKIPPLRISGTTTKVDFKKFILAEDWG
jgi:hypothetical protein